MKNTRNFKHAKITRSTIVGCIFFLDHSSFHCVVLRLRYLFLNWICCWFNFIFAAGYEWFMTFKIYVLIGIWNFHSAHSCILYRSPDRPSYWWRLSSSCSNSWGTSVSCGRFSKTKLELIVQDRWLQILPCNAWLSGNWNMYRFDSEIQLW